MIVPYREHPLVGAIPAAPGPDHVVAGDAKSDQFAPEPTADDAARWRDEIAARLARRIRPGFYRGAEPLDR